MSNVCAYDELSNRFDDPAIETALPGEEQPSSDYVPSFTEKQLKKNLLALVEMINREQSCGYTAAEMQKMVQNMYNACSKQVSQDLRGSLNNRRAPIHRSVEEAVSTMCYLGVTKKHKFDASRANFSTFICTVFHNACCSLYDKRYHDVRYYAESTAEPVSDEEDAMTLGDFIASLDLDGERGYAARALRDAIDFVIRYAETHLSAATNNVFTQHLLNGRDSQSIADEIGKNKKSVENAYDRAMRCLRLDAREELDCMLQKKYGFRDVDDMLYTIDLLKEDYYSAA